MTQLTKNERATLNRAIKILAANTPEDASWYLSVLSGNWVDLTYFTALKTQLSGLAGETFADKVQAGIDRETHEVANKDAAKEHRIAELERQLASLTAPAS